MCKNTGHFIRNTIMILARKCLEFYQGLKHIEILVKGCPICFAIIWVNRWHITMPYSDPTVRN